MINRQEGYLSASALLVFLLGSCRPAEKLQSVTDSQADGLVAVAVCSSRNLDFGSSPDIGPVDVWLTFTDPRPDPSNLYSVAVDVGPTLISADEYGTPLGVIFSGQVEDESGNRFPLRENTQYSFLVLDAADGQKPIAKVTLTTPDCP